MDKYVEFFFDFLSEFAGGRGGIDHSIVQFGITGMLWTWLLIFSSVRQINKDIPREKLLVFGFTLGMLREFFMMVMSVLLKLNFVSHDRLHVYFPPFEHALSNIALVVIAGAFLRYILDQKRLALRYIFSGVTAVLLCYLATFYWWAEYITANPSSKFGQTWCDWLFRINACVWLAIPMYFLLKVKRSWLRNTICLALSFFFLNEFLKLPDMALGELYENMFAPVRHTLYMLAIPLLGYVYFRELNEQLEGMSQELMTMNKELDQRVRDRTAQIEAIQKTLVENAHRSGMADITTGVLHNVGNIMTSVNNTVTVITNKLQQTEAGALKNISGIIHDHMDDLPTFLANDPKGQAILKYYSSFSDIYQRENRELINHTHKLFRQLASIVEIIGAQQDYGSQKYMLEELSLDTVVDDALKIQRPNFNSDIEIEKHFEKTPPVFAHKSKLIHVLVNLFINANDALSMPENSQVDKKIIVRIEKETDNVYIKLTDNGIGIRKELLEKVFSHSFTTKKNGYGFGLHSSANYIKEMNGSIWAESDGEGKGSTFIIQFPISTT